ncbi:MAG: HAD family hydrolase [Cyanobacteria bacterium P01_D01_bin.128]
MMYPKIIFLDAVGTLFGVRGSVGQVYRDLAQKVDVTTQVQSLDKGFLQAFKAAPAMAFPDAEPTQIPLLEYNWWYQVAQETFRLAGVLEQFDRFDRFFADVYAHFAIADPWEIYPDALSTLNHWRKSNVSLGIISNFDSRIYSVLESLELESFFESVTISTEVGAAKPDGKIFEAALQKHGCSPEDAWHVGDSREMDYEGAKAAGLHGIWIQRV